MTQALEDQALDQKAPDILVIIPARGGSKGLPRKNVLPLEGKPLIAHNIEAALASQHVTRVVVSTDDAEIADAARAHGAEVVIRPAALAGDTASSESALLHVLDQLAQTEAYRPDITVFMQCTSPLTAPEDIDGTIDKMLSDGADCALAVTAFHYFIWQADAQHGAVGINHDSSVRLMRQQRTPEFLETGAVYAMRTDGFTEHKHRFFGQIGLHEIPSDRVLEIDDPADFKQAEERMRRLAQSGVAKSGHAI